METTVTSVLKASDLRIGNKVFYNERIVDVFMLDTAYIYEDNSITNTEEIIAIDKCEGIPLLPELLDKYGITKEGRNNYRKRGLNFEFRFDGKEVTCVFGCSRCRSGVSIATIVYLHQLQNLVYDLTGMELEMSL